MQFTFAGNDSEGLQYGASVDQWYRDLLKIAVPPLIAKWERLIGVKVERFFVQRMKTKWGSCSPGSRSLRLNTDLAKKPSECLEYIVVHEMAHQAEAAALFFVATLVSVVVWGCHYYETCRSGLRPARKEDALEWNAMGKTMNQIPSA